MRFIFIRPTEVLGSNIILYSPGISVIVTEALATLTPSTIIKRNSILWRKMVSSFTMSLSSVHCMNSIATQCVNSGSYSFKMLWVYAKHITAQMVNYQPIRNFAYQIFVGESMSRMHAAYAIFWMAALKRLRSKYSVTTGIYCSNPIPAIIGFLYFGPKTLKDNFPANIKYNIFNHAVSITHNV